MKRKTFPIILLALLFCGSRQINAAANFLSGRILLQVESKGEAWYVNPKNEQRYYLGRPSAALDFLRSQAIGISLADLSKIPVGVIAEGTDSDHDGLPDSLEKALGTDPLASDTDQDNYSDQAEITSGYNPLGGGKKTNQAFSAQQTGKIFLSTEQNGEAWYVYPLDQKRYYLGNPADTFSIMKKLSLGISNRDLDKIAIGSTAPADNRPPVSQTSTADTVYRATMTAIKAKDDDQAAQYYRPEYQKTAKYELSNYDDTARERLIELMSIASPSANTADKKTYTASVYYNGATIPIEFVLNKDSSGQWFLENMGQAQNE